MWETEGREMTILLAGKSPQLVTFAVMRVK